MKKSSTSASRTFLSNSKRHNGRWQELVEKFLPISVSDSIWRYSRQKIKTDSDQGWKLHVSANILTATKILSLVGPFLAKKNVLFKAPCSLQELQKLNSGLYYGYSQVGKFITVYPRSSSEARGLASELHRLTKGNAGPVIPFDERFRSDSNVYYRYGSFKVLNIEHADGKVDPAIRDQDGNLMVDDRYNCATPTWETNPFKRQVEKPAVTQNSFASTPYRILKAITQRGKGGVYEAIDFSAAGPRFCVVKQGRRGGEVQWNGKDGTWLVKKEIEVLEKLAAAGVEVPRIYSKFVLNKDFYLVLENVEGETLENFLEKRRRRLSVSEVLNLCSEVCGLLMKIHDAGWVWRDCKPSNLILTNERKLRPLDFEGAAKIDEPDWLVWQTPAFLPPLSKFDITGKLAKDDVYSVGVICYFLLTGQMPEEPAPKAISVLRRGIPRKLQQLVSDLMALEPDERPDLKTALTCFSSI
jgi:hypothetical protein